MASLWISMEMILFITLSCHWGKFLPPAHSLSHQCCLTFTLWCAFVNSVWLYRGIHIRSSFARTSNSTAIAIPQPLRHQCLENPASTNLLYLLLITLNINFNIFLLFYSLSPFSLPSKHITALSAAHREVDMFWKPFKWWTYLDARLKHKPALLLQGYGSCFSYGA